MKDFTNSQIIVVEGLQPEPGLMVTFLLIRDFSISSLRERKRYKLSRERLLRYTRSSKASDR